LPVVAAGRNGSAEVAAAAYRAEGAVLAFDEGTTPPVAADRLAVPAVAEIEIGVGVGVVPELVSSGEGWLLTAESFLAAASSADRLLLAALRGSRVGSVLAVDRSRCSEGAISVDLLLEGANLRFLVRTVDARSCVPREVSFSMVNSWVVGSKTRTHSYGLAG